MSAGENVTPSLCVVGTLAFDDVATPAGTRWGVLGGSATYFSIAASYFTRVGLVGVVGDDFPEEYRSLLEARGVDLSGLQVDPAGRTFHWAGRYEGTMEQAETLVTDLNVLGGFSPKLPDALRASPYVFLANTDPGIQHSVLDQLSEPRMVVLDTMNLWIDSAREELLEVMSRVDGVVINDAEARALGNSPNLIAAGSRLLEYGPRFVIVKKGEHGSFLFSKERFFALPSYPLEEVIDPTGAGDSFAGGVLGYLAGVNGTAISDVCRAMIYGTVVASYAVSSFSVDSLSQRTRGDLDARAEQLRAFTSI